jgi:hypothetical protein
MLLLLPLQSGLAGRSSALITWVTSRPINNSAIRECIDLPWANATFRGRAASYRSTRKKKASDKLAFLFGA